MVLKRTGPLQLRIASFGAYPDLVMGDEIAYKDHVSRLCSGDLIAVGLTDTLLGAAQKMAHKRIGALAVMHQGDLVGVITEADVVCAIAEGASPTTTVVADYMTEAPVTVASTDGVDLAARRMIEHGIGHLPVMDSGVVVGMVSRGDLLAVGAVPTPRQLID